MVVFCCLFELPYLTRIDSSDFHKVPRYVMSVFHDLIVVVFCCLFELHYLTRIDSGDLHKVPKYVVGVFHDLVTSAFVST